MGNCLLSHSNLCCFVDWVLQAFQVESLQDSPNQLHQPEQYAKKVVGAPAGSCIDNENEWLT